MLDFKQYNFLYHKVWKPIFFTDDDLVSEVVLGECFAGSDHYMVWCTVGANVRPLERWDLRRADYNSVVFVVICLSSLALKRALLKTCGQTSALNTIR